jgi:YesN/AraC family two-component response regulator
VYEQASDEFIYQYSPGLYSIPHSELRQYPEPSLTVSMEAKPVLLFVDDHEDMRHYIKSSMEDMYIIHDASNGLEGLEKARQLMPDIIVSDVMMPEMDGMEMCKRIKQDIHTCHLPVILLTAKISEDFTIEGFDAGADDYIAKPFNIRILQSRIKNILELRSQLRERFRKEGILQPSEVSFTSHDEIFLKNAMDVVERHIGNAEFRVCTFVSEMNMSRSVLYRKFESLTGQSVNEFVRNVRLKRAAQILALNELTVSEVSYEVGFNDPQYFSKCFNKFFGMTPSEYARNHAKKLVE